MRVGWVLSAVFVLAAGAGAQDIRRPPGPADRAAVMTEGWEKATTRLGALLDAAYQGGGPGRPGATGNSAYRQWLNLWKWCRLLSVSEREEASRMLRDRLRRGPDGERTFFGLGFLPPEDWAQASPEEAAALIADEAARRKYLGALVAPEFLDPTAEPLASRLKPEVLAEWVNDEEFSRLVFQNLSTRDYAPGVLQRLQEIRLAHPAKFREYRSLALALALVYDQNLPDFWPHPQVDPNVVPRRPVRVADFFAEWVAANESRSLLLDVRRLRPEQLKFLVDAPVDSSDYAWARKNVRFSRAELGKAFGSVRYDENRLQRREFDWTKEPYTLEEIRSRGGICVDQAYYAMVAGKARGVPTLFFTGQGADGGHAWFGYMKADDKWELDCGRYENQNYSVGEALDSQTWTPFSDHDLAFLTRSFRDKLEYAASQDDLLMAARFEAAGDMARAGRASDSAVQVCPENVAAWDARTAFLRRAGAPIGQRRALFEAALRQFPRDPDIRSRYQLELAAVMREGGDAAGASALETQIVSSNKRRRADLSVNLAAQKLAVLVTEKNFDAAFAEYRRMLVGLGRSGGGTFFYEIVRPFAEALEDAGDARRAAEAVALARKTLQPESGSVLDGDLRELSESLVKPRG